MDLRKAFNAKGVSLEDKLGLFATDGDPASEEDGSVPPGSMAFGADSLHIKTLPLGWVALPLVFYRTFVDLNGAQSQMLVSPDPGRGGKLLATSPIHVSFNGSSLQNGGFLGVVIPDFNDLGWPAPLNATLVAAEGFSKQANGGADFDLYDGDTLIQPGFFSLPAGGSVNDHNIGLNIDVAQGQMIRVRVRGGNPVQDAAIRLYFRWRAG